MRDQDRNELVTTRILNAPIELVWKAWIIPERVKKWWGPKGFTSPFCKIDFKVGGKYVFCMRDPKGKRLWSTGVYKEIVPLKKIVVTDSFADRKGNVVHASYYGFVDEDWPLELQATITFDNLGTRTKMTLYYIGIPSGKLGEDTRISWNQSFDKLAASLK